MNTGWHTEEGQHSLGLIQRPIMTADEKVAY